MRAGSLSPVFDILVCERFHGSSRRGWRQFERFSIRGDMLDMQSGASRIWRISTHFGSGPLDHREAIRSIARRGHLAHFRPAEDRFLRPAYIKLCEAPHLSPPGGANCRSVPSRFLRWPCPLLHFARCSLMSGLEAWTAAPAGVAAHSLQATTGQKLDHLLALLMEALSGVAYF